MYSPVSLKIKNIISFEGEHEYFFSKDPKVISGCNYDNTSQKINGAGKSAFIESIAFAFAGSSIRDVKAKELVNRSSKEGEVEVVLSNSKFQRNLKIWRKLYSGTKSSECRVWLGDEEVRLPDVLSYNKFIFDEIGITKDDFFNFYLLVQANYAPFLRVGDVKKKEIINRFSGADSVDQLIPLVKADLTMFDPEFNRINKAIQLEQGKIEAYTESIQSIIDKETTWEVEKQSQIDEIHAKIDSTMVSIAEKNALNFETLKEAKRLREDLISNDYVGQVDELERKRTSKKAEQQALNATINNLNAELKQVKGKKEYLNEINEIIAREKQLNQQIKESREAKKEYEQLRSEIEVALQDVIECPKCTHHFSFKNAEFNEQEAEASLVEIKSELESLEKQIAECKNEIDVTLEERKQQINKQIQDEQQQIRVSIESESEKVAKYSVDISAIAQQIATIEEKERVEKSTIVSKLGEIRSTRYSRDVLSKAISSYNQQIEQINKIDLSKEREVIQTNLDKSTINITELTKEFDQLTEDRKVIAAWETNFKDFKSYVANQSIKNIEDYTNLFLQEMGSDLGIHLDGFRTLATGKIKEQISVDVLRSGFNEGSYGAFSGGERGRIDICVILAIQQLININCSSGGLDLLICDEILDQIDSLGLESIINSLQNLDRTIMIVSQNEINSLKEHLLLIEKRNKVSTFAL